MRILNSGMKGVVVTKKLYKGDNVICNFFPTNESSESWFAANYYDWSFFASDPRLCLPILSYHIVILVSSLVSINNL